HAAGGAVAYLPQVALRLVSRGPGRAPDRVDRPGGFPCPGRAAPGWPHDRLPRPRPFPARDDRGPGAGEVAPAPAARGLGPGLPRESRGILLLHPRAAPGRRAAVARVGWRVARDADRDTAPCCGIGAAHT